MLRALWIVLGVAMTAVPAAASDVDPKALVLSRSDLPAGYTLDSRQTGVFSNQEFSARYAARLGRVTGYVAAYRRQGREIVRSRTDLFGRPAGARQLLRSLDDVYRSRGRQSAGVGTEGWVYSSGIWAMVVWRHGTLLGVLDSWGLGKVRVLKLARLQQRRMARSQR